MTLLKVFFQLVMIVSVAWCSENIQQADLITEIHAQTLSVCLPDSSFGNVLLKEEGPTKQSPYLKHEEIEDVCTTYWGIYKTRKGMRLLASSASAGNPIHTLYLAHAFNLTRYVGQNMCPFALPLYQKAFQGLEEIALQASHPYFHKACCLLAGEYAGSKYTYYLGIISNRADRSLKYLENINTREANLLRLWIKLTYEIYDASQDPSLEDLLVEENLKYFPNRCLYIIALFGFDSQKKIEVLKRCLQIVEHPVFAIELANIYKEDFKYTNDASDKENAMSLYEKAGKLGSPTAYMKMAEFLAHYDYAERSFDLKEIETLEDLLKCKEYLQKAAALGLPEAFHNLACLAYEYYIRTLPSYWDDFDEAAYEAVGETMLELWIEAARHGFWGIYDKLDDILEPDDPFFVEYPNLDKEKENLFNQVMGSEGQQ